MNSDPNPAKTGPSELPDEPTRKPQKQVLLQFPGLVAISLYMILLAGVAIVYVVQGRISPVYLAFSVFFVTGALGLMLLLRWAWALTLAGTALMTGTYLFHYSSQHSIPSLMQGLLNLVFFLYLVRTEVREKLK